MPWISTPPEAFEFSQLLGFQARCALRLLRFLAGVCFSHSLAIVLGTVDGIYRPAQHVIPSTIFILTPFLGPGLRFGCCPAPSDNVC